MAFLRVLLVAMVSLSCASALSAQVTSQGTVAEAPDPPLEMLTRRLR